MKRIIIILFVLSGMLAACLYGGLGTMQSARKQSVRLSLPRTATAGQIRDFGQYSQTSLALAKSLYEGFPANQNHSLRVTAAVEMVNELIERGDIVEAIQVVNSLELAQRWICQAKIARELFRNGESAEASRLLKECLAGASYFGGIPREMIDVELAPAMAAGGMEDRAWQTVRSLVDDARSELAKAKLIVELFRLGYSTNISINVSSIDLPSTYSPEYLPAAETLLDIIPILLDRREDPMRLEKAVGLSKALRDYVARSRGNATRFYLKLAKIFGHYGEITLMSDALAGGYPHFINLSAAILDYYKMVAGLAQMSEAAGRREVAIKLLAEAPKAIDLLPTTERPLAWAYLGQASNYLGQFEKSESHFRKAMQAALEIPNPPAAQLNTIQVALLMAKSGVDPGEEIVGLLGGKSMASVNGQYSRLE